MPIVIDWSISIGNIVSTAALIATLVGIAIRFSQRIDVMEKKVNIMFSSFINQDIAKTMTAEQIRNYFGQ